MMQMKLVINWMHLLELQVKLKVCEWITISNIQFNNVYFFNWTAESPARGKKRKHEEGEEAE